MVCSSNKNTQKTTTRKQGDSSPMTTHVKYSRPSGPFLVSSRVNEIVLHESPRSDCCAVMLWYIVAWLVLCKSHPICKQNRVETLISHGERLQVMIKMILRYKELWTQACLMCDQNKPTLLQRKGLWVETNQQMK